MVLQPIDLLVKSVNLRSVLSFCYVTGLQDNQPHRHSQSDNAHRGEQVNLPVDG